MIVDDDDDEACVASVPHSVCGLITAVSYEFTNKAIGEEGGKQTKNGEDKED